MPDNNTSFACTSPPAAPWWNDAVFYQILVDRFRLKGSDLPLGDPSRPVFCGGSLWGVIEKLGYLSDLGIDTLWLSPIQRTASYHGYHIIDLERVDRRFGGMAAFNALLKTAKPDFRIVLDYVPNHLHRSHPFFQHARKRRNSSFRDWFYFDDQGGYLCFLDHGELPKLNLDHPEARRYVIDCALQWLDRGIDGFRLDHVLGPSMDFWRDFYKAVKTRKPSACMFGEALFAGIDRNHLVTLHLPHKHRHVRKFKHGESVADDIMLEYVDVMDGTLDFGFREIMKKEIAHAQRPAGNRHVQDLLDAHYAIFPEGFTLLSFLDNHDMNRFLFEASDRLARLKRAAEIQFQQQHPPILYYGTEVGMSHAHPVYGPHGDLNARQMMPWTTPNYELLEFYTDLIHRRKASRAISGKPAVD